jgi:DNA-3-methyladenine glycosylase
MEIIQKPFYQRDTIIVAQELLGKKLVRIINGQIIAGIIIETEAYGHANDSASHAYRIQTKRNAPMFGEAGCAYVYFVYGNHFCFNITAKAGDAPAGAVLIRSLVPTDGIQLMQQHRKKDDVHILTNGPGKLAQALQINKEHNFVSITEQGQLFVVEQRPINQGKIIQAPRIGISSAKDKLWRFILEDHSVY